MKSGAQWIRSPLLLILVVLLVDGYFLKQANNFPGRKPYLISSTWQEDLDKILDVETPCDSRRNLLGSFINRLEELSSDVQTAVREKNVEKIAPRNLQYGKAVQGMKVFKNQLLTDVIPDLFIKDIPKLVDEGPKLVNTLIEKGPSSIFENTQRILENIRELSQDPGSAQLTMNELQNEIKNVVKRTPIGLETPSYEVLQSREEYEIRKYPSYSIAKTTYMTENRPSSTNSIPMDVLLTSSAFQRLANYIFGANSRQGKSEKMKMTVPVIMDNTSMSFILSQEYTSQTAPFPDSQQILFEDVINEIVAVREFTGLVTEGEISRQKLHLEEALQRNSIDYDVNSFKILQYNPPYTVPWVRRNELVVRVKFVESVITKDAVGVTGEASTSSPSSSFSSSSIATDHTVGNDRSITEDTAKYYSSPEAGD